MMQLKYAYDTEFRDDGTTIDLISIGIVCEDGREYYAENADCDFRAVCEHNWLWQNVVPHLNTSRLDFDPRYPIDRTQVWADMQASCVKPKWVIRNEVRDFFFKSALTRKDRTVAVTPELYAYFSAFDHVLLHQLFGPLPSLPDGIPMYSNEINQLIVDQPTVVLPPQPPDVHHALADARWNMSVLRTLGVVK
jgi:hypothetical protein